MKMMLKPRTMREIVIKYKIENIIKIRYYIIILKNG